MIGFAAETEDLEVHALDKLRRKKLDLIVGNDVSRSDAGFGVDTNIVTMLSADGRVETTPKLLKDEVADVILDRLIGLRANKSKSRCCAPPAENCDAPHPAFQRIRKIHDFPGSGCSC